MITFSHHLFEFKVVKVFDKLAKEKRKFLLLWIYFGRALFWILPIALSFFVSCDFTFPFYDIKHLFYFCVLSIYFGRAPFWILPNALSLSLWPICVNFVHISKILNRDTYDTCSSFLKSQENYSFCWDQILEGPL